MNLKGRTDVKIICDISMGGTNPDELRKLGAPDNQNLRYIRDFHAKAYLSDNGTVVTSANASNNGIGFGGSGAGLIEAGYFTTEIESIGDWFELQWSDAQSVNKQTLIKCVELWEARKRAFERFSTNSKPMSLIDALRSEPGRLYGIQFAFASDEVDETAVDAARVEANEIGINLGGDHDFVHFEPAANDR